MFDVFVFFFFDLQICNLENLGKSSGENLENLFIVRTIAWRFLEGSICDLRSRGRVVAWQFVKCHFFIICPKIIFRIYSTSKQYESDLIPDTVNEWAINNNNTRLILDENFFCKLTYYHGLGPQFIFDIVTKITIHKLNTLRVV